VSADASKTQTNSASSRMRLRKLRSTRVPLDWFIQTECLKKNLSIVADAADS
jgi:hypothetical protein